MWAKVFMTDVVVLVATVIFIIAMEDHYNRKVPDAVKCWGGAILLTSIVLLPISLIGAIWT